MATETTNYGLTKPGYSDTADVADINENMDKIDGVLNYVSDAIGIVVDGDKTAYADGVEIGQFVILRNSTITGCDDGLYKAAKTIPYNTVIDSTYLTAEPSGAANALNASLKHITVSATTAVYGVTRIETSSKAIPVFCEVTQNGEPIPSAIIGRDYNPNRIILRSWDWVGNTFDNQPINVTLYYYEDSTP